MFSVFEETHLRGLLESLDFPSVAGLHVDILRLDKLHPLLSGNKIFKLQGYIQRFSTAHAQALLSFGGPYSNHLHALAAYGFLSATPVVLMVRGYAHLPLTPTLQDCVDWGAQLIFADKRQYARRYESEWQEALAQEYQALVIPEGGSGEAGEKGCQSIAPVCADYDEVWSAVGTGTTALGIARALSRSGSQTALVGVNAVADQGKRQRTWQQQMPANVHWRLIDNAHGGGFGRCPAALIECIQRWDQRGLPLDPVYTGKLMQAFEQAAADGVLHDRRILLIHSGGLQGRRGVPVLC